MIPTPEMIAAAWAILRERWPGQPHLLGPGPAFREAITAAPAVMPAEMRARLAAEVSHAP